jgi:hypothetical protein
MSGCSAEAKAIFLEWQAEYASKNIATFPVSITDEGKRPLVSHYQRIGLPASAQVARRFANARGIGFMAGSRNNITVLDIDEPGDKPLQRALDRHGETPITSDLPLIPDILLSRSKSTFKGQLGLGIVLATDTIWRVLTAPYGLSSPR